MKIPIYQVDAFTSNIFKGNPAAVCPLKEWLTDDLMQNIAMENNLSETAFFIEDKDFFHIRWFTPKAELDLAGHPTLATAHIILTEYYDNKKDIIFKTKIKDTLNVRLEKNIYVMDFPSRFPSKNNNIDVLEDALGKRPIETMAHRDLIAVYENEDAILSIQPNMDKLLKLDYPAVIITAPGKNVDFVSRNFAPKLGIPEDPVTGSAHCELIPYWSKKFNKTKMIAHQLSNRGGEIYCIDNDERVSIGGSAITFLKGEIFV